MSDEEEVLVIKVLPPTQLIRIECSTCGHPFVTRSSKAFEESRADHIRCWTTTVESGSDERLRTI